MGALDATGLMSLAEDPCVTGVSPEPLL